jgi:nucleotide-binding universal stress UspA family protein
MKKIRRIMVAIDLSEYSKDVLEYAAELAESTKSDLVIINVINHRDVEILQNAAVGTRGFSIKDWMKRQKEERTEAIQGLIGKTVFGHLSIKTVLREGAPFRELIKAVDKEKADLVVMGVKGRGNVPGVLAGSTAERVFRHCPVPILNVCCPR